MLTKDSALKNKSKMERLALIKERYNRLVLRHRQVLERELDYIKDDEEYTEEIDAEPIAEYDAEEE